MGLKRLILSHFIFFTTVHTVTAQLVPYPNQVRFQRISQNEIYGLGKVWDVLEDHLGFIWFATEDGLFMYDGYEFQNFKRGDSPGALSSNLIVDLHEDTNNHLWIATLGGGLNLFSRDENKFYQIRHVPKDPKSFPSDRVNCIYEDRVGKLWFGTEGGGVVSMDPFEGELDTARIKFTFYQQRSNEEHEVTISNDFIRSNITEDKAGNLYIGTYGGGVTVINPSRDKSYSLKSEPRNPNSIASNFIYELLVDSKNRLWIGTEGNGVTLYLIDKNEYVQYRPANDGKSIPNPQVDAIAEDVDENIWIGTDDGLCLLLNSSQEKPENNFATFRHEPLNEGSLLTNSIKKISKDRRNSLWIASYYGGVNKYNPRSFEFTPIRAYPWLDKTLTDNNVTAFAEDKNGNLWIGTDGGGLNFLEGGVKDIFQTNYKYIELINPVTRRAELKIKSLLLDDDDNLWIGTWGGGMLKYQINTGRIQYFGQDDPTSGLYAYSVMSMAKEKNGTLWFSTFNQGLARYDKNTGKFTLFHRNNQTKNHLPADHLNMVMVDSEDRVWVGGEIGGLCLLDTTKDSFVTVRVGNAINENTTVNCLTQASNGSLWVGTGSGIVIYDEDTGKIEKYGMKDGLLSDGIQSIVEGKRGVFWISTTNGLTSFNRKTNSFTSYTYLDGLQGNNFHRNSSLKLTNGMLVFGGSNGWNGFDPSAIRKRDEKAPIAFTRFFVNGVPVTVNTKGSPLRREINSGTTIKLQHDQNNFAVIFSLLEYNFARLANYQYKLDGFNETWVNLGKERMAAFTNLDPGSYTLKVRASNKDGYWHEGNVKLSITILPAWWQTMGFKISAALILAALLWGGMKLRVRQLTTQRNKLEKLVKVRTESLATANRMLTEKNNEILVQNEELSSQNDQIISQREELFTAKRKLEEINQTLEELVLKRTEHLNDVITKLDISVKTLDRFVYSASHDLSAPMKTIRGLLHVASLEKDPAKTLEYFELIRSSIRRFEEVIMSMTNFSRNAFLDVVLEPVNLSAMVDQIFQDLKYWPEAAEISFKNETGKDIVLAVDKYRLDTILQNLVGNAIKYADRRKSHSYISVSCQLNGKIWVLEVSDNGIGIQQNYIGKIFDMFFKASERSKGSGLGLFIVSEAVSKLNGEIQVESTYGEGTTFRIFFNMNSESF